MDSRATLIGYTMSSHCDGLLPMHNVTSAKLLSPFRYPGGKTWLVPLICEWLNGMNPRPVELVEPFAGGGIVSLNALFGGLVDRVTLVELDEDVAAVWRVIVDGDADGLADRITQFDLTLPSVESELAKPAQSLDDRAFQTILRNRVHRGGIMTRGAGLLKQGEDGKGIRSRWYPETLKKRILQIARHRKCITFIQGDGLDVLRRSFDRTDAVFFIDPPYIAGHKQAGRRLYRHHEVEYEELFRVVSTLTGDFLMTYSHSDRIFQLAQLNSFVVREVAMKSNHHAIMTELLIGRDLGWIRHGQKP